MLFLPAALLRPARRLTRRESQAISGSGNTGWKAEGYGTFPKRGDRAVASPCPQQTQRAGSGVTV